MSFCTVQEAWGPDFGRANNIRFQAPVASGAPKKIENFSDYSSYHHGYDDQHGHYTTVDQPKVNHQGADYHNPNRRKHMNIGLSNNPGGVPYAHDDQPMKQPSAFYPLDADAGKEHILNFSYDYDEEPQLQRSTQNKENVCNGVFKHLIECSECRKKLIRAIDESNANNANKAAGNETPNNSTESNELDFTELALFIACGIFFIFLLDAIVKIARRYK